MIAVILRATTVRFICFLVHKSNNDWECLLYVTISFSVHTSWLLKASGLFVAGGWEVERRERWKKAQVQCHLQQWGISCLCQFILKKYPRHFISTYPADYVPWFQCHIMRFQRRGSVLFVWQCFLHWMWVDWICFFQNTGYTRGYGGLQDEEGSLWRSNERLSQHLGRAEPSIEQRLSLAIQIFFVVLRSQL